MASPEQSPNIISAPFTDEEVENLNYYQKEGSFNYPLTCLGKIHELSSPELIAQKEGWKCPDQNCDYLQPWAYSYMANRPIIEQAIQNVQKYPRISQ